MARSIALAVSLLLAALIAFIHELPPRPAAADAPAERFSAQRAFTDVQALSQRPRPVGSDAHSAAARYIEARLRSLGLSPQRQTAAAFDSGQSEGRVAISAGVVNNIIAVIPGREPRAPAIALMAHYDSVLGSPGAADDAAGVAAILETAGALGQGPAPRRDIILIFTDAEEAGLLGARAFFRDHPLAPRIGFVINLEARGGGGRAQMFQTGPGNAQTIEAFQASVLRPASSSLAVFLYERMPNDTDFSVPRALDVAGVNLAFIGRQFDYHAPTSTAERLDRGALQDLGGQALAVTRRLAEAQDLPSETSDLVYAHLPIAGLIAYPPAVGWALLGLAAGLLAIAVLRARPTRPLSLADIARGAGAGIYLLACAATLLRAARVASGAEHGFLGQRFLSAQTNLWETSLVLLGLGVSLYTAASLARGRVRLPAALLPLAAGLLAFALDTTDLVTPGLAIAAALIAITLFARPAATAGAWTGVLLLGLAAGAALQALAPATAFLVAWPLVLGALSAAVCRLGHDRSLAATGVVVALCAGALGWIGGFAHGLYLGLDMPELLAAPAWLSAFVLWPMTHPRIGGPGRITAAMVLALGVVGVLAVRLAPPWSERHPQASLVTYVSDLEAGKSFRASAAPYATEWTKAVLGSSGGQPRTLAGLAPIWSRPLEAAPAPFLAGPAARLRLTQSGQQLVLEVVPPKGALAVYLDLGASSPVSGVRLAGLNADPLMNTPGALTRLRWAGDAPFAISFIPAEPGVLSVTHAAVLGTWPAKATPLPPRPAHVMAFDVSDSWVVRDATQFSYPAGTLANRTLSGAPRNRPFGNSIEAHGHQ